MPRARGHLSACATHLDRCVPEACSLNWQIQLQMYSIQTYIRPVGWRTLIEKRKSTVHKRKRSIAHVCIYSAMARWFFFLCQTTVVASSLLTFGNSGTARVTNKERGKKYINLFYFYFLFLGGRKILTGRQTGWPSSLYHSRRAQTTRTLFE